MCNNIFNCIKKNNVKNCGVGDYQQWFDTIAACLFNNYQLVVCNLKKEKYNRFKESMKMIFNFKEIEFYYFDQHHQDVFAHFHELQKTSGKIYIHYAGIDITFGDENSYGGILIRGLELVDLNNIMERRVFYTPGTLADTILQKFGEYSSNNAFQIYLNKKNDNSNFGIGINKQIKKIPRVGLYYHEEPRSGIKYEALTHFKEINYEENIKKYIFKPYRYLRILDGENTYPDKEIAEIYLEYLREHDNKEPIFYFNNSFRDYKHNLGRERKKQLFESFLKNVNYGISQCTSS